MEGLLGLHPAKILTWAALWLIIISIIAPTIRRASIRRQLAHSHGCRPIARACNKDPFLGLDVLRANLKASREHVSLELTRGRHARLGNTFTSKQLFTHAIWTVEPENIKAILSLNFKDYGIGYRLERFIPLLGVGIFDTDGDHWAMSRSLIRPNFTRDQVADLSVFETLIPDLIALIPRDGKTSVDLQDLFFRYTIDSASEFLLGESVGSLRKSSQKEMDFAEAFNYAQKAIRKRGLLGSLHHFYKDDKADRCNKFCREYARRFVEEAVEKNSSFTGHCSGKSQRYIFSHELAKQTSDKERILDEIMNVLLAGRDTTASLLSNMFFMFAKNPAIWEKLRNEIASLHGKEPTYEELRDLKYLKCCLNESLRTHPVVPENEREAINDTILPVGGGSDGLSPVSVPKGTRVVYSIYTMHRRTDIYGPDADEFRPERWESGKLQPRWEYLPFNGGPRICVGQQFALTEAGYVTVRIAQEFRKLESRDPGPWEELLGLTLSSRNGTQVCFAPV